MPRSITEYPAKLQYVSVQGYRISFKEMKHQTHVTLKTLTLNFYFSLCSTLEKYLCKFTKSWYYLRSCLETSTCLHLVVDWKEVILIALSEDCDNIGKLPCCCFSNMLWHGMVCLVQGLNNSCSIAGSRVAKMWRFKYKWARSASRCCKCS